VTPSSASLWTDFCWWMDDVTTRNTETSLIAIDFWSWIVAIGPVVLSLLSRPGWFSTILDLLAASPVPIKVGISQKCGTDVLLWLIHLIRQLIVIDWSFQMRGIYPPNTICYSETLTLLYSSLFVSGSILRFLRLENQLQLEYEPHFIVVARAIITIHQS